MEIIHNKLVRDRIPEIIENDGRVAEIRILDDEEYRYELEKKLREECEEVIASSGIDRMEELADVLEVLHSLASSAGFSFDDVEKTRSRKREERGGFAGKIYLTKSISGK